ncbi:hypothetical protein PtA15_1A162 [Puccinia triticina]|uniref:Uncharacterized protein n=1 Tax=Puccinia triticina TaxID=208348 RepID=A0ABY7C781_9BASI|nr:uncharacterized protein PtA15_1A162 [Puccinia triticina]WAQ80824.1 hypothetical protein PtA15_1A162 [Puccinia triticina]
MLSSATSALLGHRSPEPGWFARRARSVPMDCSLGSRPHAVSVRARLSSSFSRSRDQHACSRRTKHSIFSPQPPPARPPFRLRSSSHSSASPFDLKYLHLINTTAASRVPFHLKLSHLPPSFATLNTPKLPLIIVSFPVAFDSIASWVPPPIRLALDSLILLFNTNLPCVKLELKVCSPQ